MTISLKNAIMGAKYDDIVSNARKGASAMSDMYTVGMPSMKLSETEGKGGKHSGNFYKVAAEALEERQGKDLDINHEQSHLNQWEGFKSAAELKAYSDNWIAEFNAAVEKRLSRQQSKSTTRQEPQTERKK